MTTKPKSSKSQPKKSALKSQLLKKEVFPNLEDTIKIPIPKLVGVDIIHFRN